jgi:hypothetical protein
LYGGDYGGHAEGRENDASDGPDQNAAVASLSPTEVPRSHVQEVDRKHRVIRGLRDLSIQNAHNCQNCESGSGDDAHPFEWL